MDANIQSTTTGRGGYREGAGRPVGSKDRGQRLTKAEVAARITRLQQIGVLGHTADRVISALGGDEYFVRTITRLEQEKDYSKVWEAIQFLLQMRDGRPAQRINLTAMTMAVSPEDIAGVKAIVRELRPLPITNSSTEPNVGPEQGAKNDGEEG